jgi:hypothetical protein
VTDNNGVAITSAPTTVLAHQPAAANADKVLFVHGNTGPNASDVAAINRLFGRGMDVFLVTGAASTTADADGKKLVVTSSTCGSGDLAAGDKFLNLTIGLVNWEQAFEDNMRWTGDLGTDHNNIAGQTTIDILPSGAAHPLAAGFAAGPLTVTTAPIDFSWGLPAAGAVRIAQIANDPTQVTIYGFETGATLVDGSAAAGRRVHFLLTDNAFAVLNADGLKLFDAAVDWARGAGVVTTPQITAATLAGGNINITWTGGGTLEWTSALLPNNATVWTSTNDSDGSYSEPVSTAQMKIFRVRK